MQDEAETIALRKEKIKKFFRNNENLMFSLVIAFTVIFQLYYFFKLGAQPVWWDEGDYLAIAKVWAQGMPTPEWMSHFIGMRPLLLPIIWAALFKVGFGEMFIRFFTLLLPSIGAVYLLYLLGKSMYNKRVGVAAAAMLSTYWVWNFYSFRLLTDVPAVFLGLLAFYYFWNSYEKKNKPKGLYLAMLFGVLAFSTRFPYALVLVTAAAYLLITRNLRVFKDKTIWKGVGILVILLLPYLIYLISINFAPLQFYFGESAVSIKNPIQWNILGMSFTFLDSIFWKVALVLGLVSLIPLLLGLDLVWKQKNKSLNPDLLLVLWLVIHFFFYVVIIRGATDRWLLMNTVGLFLVASKGVMLAYDFLKKYNKVFAVLVALLLVLGGAYQNFNHSVDLIENKKDSYGGVKEAGLWLKENTPADSKVITPSIVQNQYYSQRDTYDLNYNEEELPAGCKDLYGATVVNDSCQAASESLFNEKVAFVNPDYYVISVYEPVFTPQWAFTYAQRNNLTFLAAFDEQGGSPQQPTIVIYEFPDSFSPVSP